jgi:hypothetical protein
MRSFWAFSIEPTYSPRSKLKINLSTCSKYSGLVQTMQANSIPAILDLQAGGNVAELFSPITGDERRM